MHPFRRASVLTAAMLLVALVAAVLAAELLPDLEQEPLESVRKNPTAMSAAALAYLLAAGTSVGVALALHPVLRRIGRTVALTAVLFRAIEAAMYTLAVVFLLGLGPLSDRVHSGTVDREMAATVAGVLLDLRGLATLAGVLAFVVGALVYYVALLRSRLVPVWLSGWGAAGAVLMATACLLSLVTGNPITGYLWAVLPIAVQEAVFAVWLLVKGFSSRGRHDGDRLAAEPRLSALDR